MAAVSKHTSADQIFFHYAASPWVAQSFLWLTAAQGPICGLLAWLLKGSSLGNFPAAI